MLNLKLGKNNPYSLRNDFEVALLEFAGTFTFLLFGLGGIQASQESVRLNNAARQNSDELSAAGVPDVNQLMYIAASMGLSLVLSAWTFYRVTGGLFNPNITTALFLVGCIGPARWALCCVAQLVGAIAACGVLQGLTPGTLAVNTSLGPGVTAARGIFLEMFLTSGLVFAVLMLAAEKHRGTFFAPIGIGLTLFAGHLWGGPFTGPSMNTARSFGPSVITGFNHNHWVYWVGPFLGTLLASGFYLILKQIKYWTLNPSQDTDTEDASPSRAPIHRHKHETLPDRRTLVETSDHPIVVEVPTHTQATFETVVPARETAAAANDSPV